MRRQAYLWQAQADKHMLRHAAVIRDKASCSVSILLSLTLSDINIHAQTSTCTHRCNSLSWGSEQHLLTVCLMIINEPSWVGREALSYPLHRQEEDWEPQGHPTVSITLPNDFSCSSTYTHACAHTSAHTKCTPPCSQSYTSHLHMCI